MVESIRFDLKERLLEPDKLRKLLALAYDVEAIPVFVHGRLTVEVTGPGFVIVAAGEAREEEMPKLKFAVLRRDLESRVVRIVTCMCSDFSIGMEQIEAQQFFCSFQSAGPKYDFPMFRYCPWCGKRLLECGKSGEVAGG